MTRPFDPSTVIIVPSGIVVEALLDADHSGDSQLAGDDRGVALLGADVDHDAGSGEEQRRPRRVGDRGDEDVERPELAGIGRVGHDPRRARRRAGAHAQPGHDSLLAVGADAITAQLPGRRRRDRPLEPERRDPRLQVLAPAAPLGDRGREGGAVGECRRQLVDRQQAQVVVRESGTPSELDERVPGQVEEAHERRLHALAMRRVEGGDAHRHVERPALAPRQSRSRPVGERPLVRRRAGARSPRDRARPGRRAAGRSPPGRWPARSPTSAGRAPTPPGRGNRGGRGTRRNRRRTVARRGRVDCRRRSRRSAPPSSNSVGQRRRRRRRTPESPEVTGRLGGLDRAQPRRQPVDQLVTALRGDEPLQQRATEAGTRRGSQQLVHHSLVRLVEAAQHGDQLGIARLGQGRCPSEGVIDERADGVEAPGIRPQDHRGQEANRPQQAAKGCARQGPCGAAGRR